MVKLILNVLILIPCLILAPQCKFSSHNASNLNDPKTHILIGEYEPLTGSESTFGQATHQGVELAIEQANQKGGLFGKQLSLISYDDQGRSDEAVTAVTKLITLDQIHIIIGETTSSRSIAGGEIAQKYHIPMISPSGTNEKVLAVGDFIFRVCFSDAFQASALAKFAFTQLKLRHGAIFKDLKNDYSIGFATAFKKKFESLGGQIVIESSYASGDLDFRAQLNKIKHANSDFLFIPGYYTEVGLIARQAREGGYRKVFLGGDGWDSPKLAEIGGQAILESYFTNHYANDDPRKMVKDFLNTYEAKYHQIPDSNAATGYDATNLAIHAMKESRDLTPQAIQKALANIKQLELVTGKMTVDKHREAIKSIQILKITQSQKNNNHTPPHFEYVTTIDP